MVAELDCLLKLMSTPILYTCLIEEQTEDEAFVQVYWSYAEHIGEAIEKVLAAARRNGMKDPQAREFDPYDISNLQGDVAPGPDSETFWATNRVFFDPEPLFQLPYGIVGSCIEGEHDLDEIASGFTRNKDGEGLTTIGVNVTRDSLFQIYSLLVRLRPDYSVFWYILHDHWDDESDRFLVNESLCTPDAILDHLQNNELDALMNGYVTLTAYLDDGATNVNISDHKRVVILTYSDELADHYCLALKGAGYPQMEELAAIDDRIYHWHYRHPDSRTREGLVNYLHSCGFRDWNPNDRREQE
jgi:hypothetical protein